MDTVSTRIPTIFTTGLFLFILWLTLIISLLQQQLSFTYLTLYLLVIIYGSKIYSYFSSYGIRRTLCIHKKRIFPESTVEVRVELENRKVLPVRIGVELKGEEGLIAKETYREAIFSGFKEGTLTWSLGPLKRGVYTLGPLSLFSLDLIGLYSIRVPWREEEEIIVYPSIYSLDGNHRLRQQLGHIETMSLFKDPQNPIGTREYLPCEPARHINWMATVRHQCLQKNIFAPSGRMTILFIIEVDGFEGEDLETMLEEVASLAAVLYKRGQRIGLLTNSQLQGKGLEYTPLREGRERLPFLLETLARITEKPKEDLLKVLERTVIEGGSTLLLFLTERRRDVENHLKERGLTTLYYPSLVDNKEISTPSSIERRGTA